MAHKAKDDFNFGISKLKREIISTHIQEYKRLKPKEVDQSELSKHANRTSAPTPTKQICPYENTQEQHIQEYKGLKPKEVDQSKISIMHPERQQQLQRSKYVSTRILEKNGITTNEPKKKNHTQLPLHSHIENQGTP